MQTNKNKNKNGGDKMKASENKLNGSEKQIKWAEDLRDGWEEHFEKIKKNKNKMNVLNRKSDQIENTIEAILNVRESSWFIDNRFENKDRVLIRLSTGNVPAMCQFNILPV